MLHTKNYIEFEIQDPVSCAVTMSWSGASRANHCLPGDKVNVSSAGAIQLLERGEHELVGVLHLTSKYMYGMTSRNVPLYLCEPLNKGYPSFRVACKEKDRSQNTLVAFTFESWDSGSELPRGSLRQVFGPVEDPSVEAMALAHLSCPYTAPKSEPAPDFLVAPDRIQFTTGTFNIDPPGCKDIDDVLTLFKNTDDSWTVAITIADVAETVCMGSKAYTMAQKIAATTYQDGYAVKPMLHSSLSEDRCSLIPGMPRYGLSLFFHWTPGKGITQVPAFCESIVVNQESYTYDSIYLSKTVPLDILALVASDLAGKTIIDSHEWIEQFMLFYNTYTAKLLASIGSGILRAHDEPVHEKSNLLRSIDPSLEFLAYKSAVYAPVSPSVHHYGLQRDLYCHASSPIRRCADLINQYILKANLQSKMIPISKDELQLIIHKLNARQKIIAAAERDFAFLKALTQADSSQVEGIALWTEGSFQFLWIPSWKTTLRMPVKEVCSPGDHVSVSYYSDRRKAKWKERIITTYSE
jgi:exoribonuclease R